MTNPKIEVDIVDILNEIKSDIKDVKEDTTAIKSEIAVLKGRLDVQQRAIDKIPDLAEKVGELKNWRQIAIIILTGTASTVFGWFLKSGKM